jgi:hypothetical protein
MRPLNEAYVALRLTAFEGRSKVPRMKRWSISFEVAQGFRSSLVRLSKVAPAVEMSKLSRNALLLPLEASLGFPACGQAAPPARKSAGELPRLAHNRCAALVVAAHNKSFERTRTGIRQLALISFWASCRLPPRAAQLQRYASA